MNYDKLVAALRYCVNARNCKKCAYRINNNSVKCRIQRVEEAADAFEALQAQMPKRGEWIDSKEIMRPDMCSACGCIYEADRFMDKIAWHYCPNCGAKMEVQE